MKWLARQKRCRRGLFVAGLAAAVLAFGVIGSTGILWGRADATPLPRPVVKARAAVVTDRDTGAVLFSRKSSLRLPPASLTKVMTALLVVEHVRNLNSYVRVSSEAVGVRGAVLGLRVGDHITVRNLLRGALVKGATDCAIALAHYVAGSETAFVTMMNAKAEKLGMTHTYFVNSSGITVPGHYSSALDLARLARAAMNNSRFRPFVATWRVRVRWTHHNLIVGSRNWLLRHYSWADGIKTGNTSAAGLCMIASGTYESRALIVVTLHEPSVANEKADVLKLFRYGSTR